MWRNPWFPWIWDQVDYFEVNFMKNRDQVWIRSAILELDNGNLGSGLVKSLAILETPTKMLAILEIAIFEVLAIFESSAAIFGNVSCNP